MNDIDHLLTLSVLSHPCFLIAVAKEGAPLICSSPFKTTQHLMLPTIRASVASSPSEFKERPEVIVMSVKFL